MAKKPTSSENVKAAAEAETSELANTMSAETAPRDNSAEAAEREPSWESGGLPNTSLDDPRDARIADLEAKVADMAADLDFLRRTFGWPKPSA